jgi:hypothetical protein
MGGEGRIGFSELLLLPARSKKFTLFLGAAALLVVKP